MQRYSIRGAPRAYARRKHMCAADGPGGSYRFLLLYCRLGAIDRGTSSPLMNAHSHIELINITKKLSAIKDFIKNIEVS